MRQSFPLYIPENDLQNSVPSRKKPVKINFGEALLETKTYFVAFLETMNRPAWHVANQPPA